MAQWACKSTKTLRSIDREFSMRRRRRSILVKGLGCRNRNQTLQVFKSSNFPSTVRRYDGFQYVAYPTNMNGGTWNASSLESDSVFSSKALSRFNDFRFRQFLSTCSHVVISLTRHHLTRLQRIQPRAQAPAYLLELTVPTNGRSIESVWLKTFGIVRFKKQTNK